MNWGLALALAALACSTPAAPTAKVPTPAEPSAASEAPPARAAAVIPARGQLFLVKDVDGNALELRALGSAFKRRLAEHADLVLYDPKLELVWLRAGDQLSVLDLRESPSDGMRPVPIASDVDEAPELVVDRGGDSIQLENGCDLLPILTLHWDQPPWLEVDEERSDEIAGHAWLERERTRRSRSPSQRLVLGLDSDEHSRAKLPRARLHCEDKELCGASVSFPGSSHEQLVITDQSEGDCQHLQCLLFNPENDTFGTPPVPKSWGSAQSVASGSCGPYRFNADGSAFLVDDQLCSAGACQPLGGTAVGWLEPGTVVGASG
jgi:hypothetical protein